MMRSKLDDWEHYAHVQLIGERSEPLVWKWVVYGMSVRYWVCLTFITQEYTEDFTDRLKRGNGRLRKYALEVAKFSQ